MLRRKIVGNYVLPCTRAHTSLATVAGLLEHKSELTAKLRAAETALAERTSVKRQLEIQAQHRPDVLAAASFGYFSAQTGLLFYWVYYRFDWNLVEPITYLLGYSVVWLGLACYFATGKEFSFDNVRSLIAERRVRHLFRQSRFDLVEYRQLECEVEDLKRRLEGLCQVR